MYIQKTPQNIRIPARRYIVLVYQAGIANVFHVPDLSFTSHDATGQYQDRRRIYQGDFRSAENICYGLGLAGRIVRSVGCNMAGDIALQDWTTDLDSLPFSDMFHPQAWN